MSDTEDLHAPREKASKIPSWIMVGFILGALTFYTVNDYLARDKKPQAGSSGTGILPASSGTSAATPAVTATLSSQQPAVAPVPPDTKTQSSPLLDNSQQMTLFAMDAIFREWSVNAMWEYNTTQVVFWNPADSKFSTFVEIFRSGSDESGYDYYYRRIDRPTRVVVRDDTHPDAPILFSESEEATKRRKQKENERRWR